MALRIKNEETCRLAAELAELTGETKTEAITVALRERLERQRRERDVRLREIRAIAKGAAGLLRESAPPLADGEELSITHSDYLYDERGLPKGGGNFALTGIESA